MTFINFRIELKTINISWDKLKLSHLTNNSKLIKVSSKELNNNDQNNLNLS